jgi:hypothetical protein
VKDTYEWVKRYAMPVHGLAPVPGTFFLFRNDYSLVRSKMVRLGLGNINPDGPDLPEGLQAFEKALANDIE